MPVTFGTIPNQFNQPAQDIEQGAEQPFNLFQSILGGVGDVLGILGRPASAVAGFTKGLVVNGDPSKAFQFAKEGILGERQFSFGDTLKALGMPKFGSGVKIPLIGEITGRGVLGFALDVLTDPLTYTGLLGVTKNAKYLSKGLTLADREVYGGMKQEFQKLYGGLLEGAVSVDESKVDSFFEQAKKANQLSDLPKIMGKPDIFEQASLPGVKQDLAATPVDEPFSASVENTPLKVAIKANRQAQIRKAFDQNVLPQLQANFKANKLAGIDPTQVDLFNNASQILDKVVDTNMSAMQMFRNIAASDMGFLGQTLTDQAAKGYRSLITFGGKSLAQIADMIGVPAPAVSQLRAMDKMVFTGIDNVLGVIKNKFPKMTDQFYRMFHAGTGIPEIDDTLSKFAGEGDSAMRDAFAQGISTLRNQNEYVKNLDPNQTRQFFRDVMDQMEFANPNNTLMLNVIPPRQFMPGSQEFAQDLRKISDQTFDLKSRVNKALNLPDMQYLPGYFPRELTPEMKLLFKNMLEDAPAGQNGILSQIAKSRSGDPAKMSTSQWNDFFRRDRSGFDHLVQAFKDPKWRKEVEAVRGIDPEMVSYFVNDPAQAIINANINATKAATKAELTQSLLKQFGRVVWTEDSARKFGENMMVPNIYKVTDWTKMGQSGTREAIRTALSLPKDVTNEDIDVMANSLKKYGMSDRINAAINPDQYVASVGGNLTGELLAKLPSTDIHTFGLLHDLKAPIYVVDEQLHRLIENMWTKTNDPSTYNVFAKSYDALTNLWKRNVTVPFPSFHARNILQDMWQMFLGGFNPIQELGSNGAWTHAFQIMKESGITSFLKNLPDEASNIARLTGKIVRADGSSITQSQMWNNFVKDGGLVGILRDIPMNGAASVDTINEALAKKLVNLKDLNPLSKDFIPVAMGGKLNEIISVNNRLANYISLWKKGMDGFDAMMNTRKVLFDYQDLSTFERNVMKRIFPFYAWSRKNIPFQLQMMIQQPGKFSNLMKAVSTLDDKNTRDTIPPGGIPDYIRQEFGVTTQQNPDGTYRFLLMGGYIPAADLVKVGSFEDIERLALKSLNPIVQAGFESATNKNFFSGLPVRSFPGEKKIFLGEPMGADTINLLRKFRPINSTDKLFFGEDPNNPYQMKDLTVPEKIMSSATGLNPRDVDVRKVAESRQKDIATIASKLKVNLQRAQQAGNTKMQDYLNNLIEESQSSLYR